MVKKESKNNEILLPNRKAFLKDVENGFFNKLVIFDISGFGNINHYYGYDFGEKILKIISVRLQERFENSQMYYLGGDIFVATASENISKERFIQTIKATTWHFGYSPIELDGHKVYIPLRAGVAINYPELLFCAEFALKQTRVLKHNLVIFDSEQHQVCHPNSLTIEQDLYWEAQIIQAIKKDRFEIFAQSISNQNDKKYEILVRMKDTKGEIVSPYFFIDRDKKNKPIWRNNKKSSSKII